jgi:hypothetical protein
MTYAFSASAILLPAQLPYGGACTTRCPERTPRAQPESDPLRQRTLQP